MLNQAGKKWANRPIQATCSIARISHRHACRIELKEGKVLNAHYNLAD